MQREQIAIRIAERMGEQGREYAGQGAMCPLCRRAWRLNTLARYLRRRCAQGVNWEMQLALAYRDGWNRASARLGRD